MKKYTLTFAAAMTHVPAHPERTAYRQQSGTLNFDYLFQVWPSATAMRKSIEMQSRREPHPNDWRAWADSKMAKSSSSRK